MLNMRIRGGGTADIQKIHRLVETDEILVGYPDGIEHPGTGKQNSKVAEELHNGTAKIPARPFLYEGILSERKKIADAIRVGLAELISRNKPFAAKVGAIAVGAIQRFVRGNYYREHIPNAPMTIRQKRGDTPLIDTGFLINSTTFVTRKGIGAKKKLYERKVTVPK